MCSKCKKSKSLTGLDLADCEKSTGNSYIVHVYISFQVMCPINSGFATFKLNLNLKSYPHTGTHAPRYTMHDNKIRN